MFLPALGLEECFIDVRGMDGHAIHPCTCTCSL